MPYCRKCGSLMNDDDIFCSKCGTRINEPLQSNNVDSIKNNSNEPFIGLTAPLYERLIDSNTNILIAGCPGSGKSTLLNSLLEVISLKPTTEHKNILIDVKQVEFGPYEGTSHCMALATSVVEAERILEQTLDLIQRRLDYMRERQLKIYDSMAVHVVIDEMADLILTSKKATNLLQRICQLGRATRIQVIVATQCPLSSVIPTRIKVDFPILIGLHTANAQQSRNIIDESGCEKLPMYGKALIRFPGEDVTQVTLPRISEEVINAAIESDK